MGLRRTHTQRHSGMRVFSWASSMRRMELHENQTNSLKLRFHFQRNMEKSWYALQVEFLPFQIGMLKFLHGVHENMTINGDCLQRKRKSLDWTQFQYDCCPWNGKRFMRIHTDTEDHVNTVEKTAIYITREMPVKKWTLPKPWRWISSLKNCWGNNFLFYCKPHWQVNTISNSWNKTI